MPKVPHDFSKEMIFYIIKCNDLEKTDIYVGSTFNFLKRKCRHKGNCTNQNQKHYNLKIYCYIRENGGWDNFTMTMLDRKICVDMLEARKHEQSLIDKYKANLNMYKAFGAETRKEYLKQWHIEHDKQYHLENADIIKERKHQFYIEHKEEIKEYMGHYRLENADIIKERKHQDYIKNIDKIKEYREEKITCECGSICCRGGISQHNKTKKHQDYLATKESVEIS